MTPTRRSRTWRRVNPGESAEAERQWRLGTGTGRARHRLLPGVAGRPDIVVDTPAALADVFVARLGRAVATAIAERGRAALAIPGGSVVRAFAPALAAAPLDWSRVDLFWSDERAVPPTDPESNYGLAFAAWLSRLSGRGPSAYRVPVDGRSLDRAARQYEADIVAALGTPPRFDLLLLGMGADGHVGSLFPGRRALEERKRLFIAIDDAPKPPPRRLTMTLPTMALARTICVAAFGHEKAAAVHAVVGDPNSILPAARVLRRHSDAVCLFDAAAASQLRRP